MRSLRVIWLRLKRDDRGAIAILLGLAITGLVGLIALAVEISMWWQTQQKMQNASDAASVSAGLNYKKGKDKTKAEAEGDALITSADRYNLPKSDYTISYTWASSSGAACASDCKSLKVDITSQPAPLFSAVIGNFMTGTNKISASSTASFANQGDACILALGRSTGTCATGGTMGAAGSYTGEGLRFNGSPNVNLANCGLMSDAQGSSSTNCNGHELNAEFVASAGSVDAACESDAGQRWANTEITPDPYDSLKSNIPSDYRDGTACSTLSTTTLNAPISASPSKLFCGTLKINASMTLSEGTYYIVNGNLEFAKGITVQGTGVTFVLTGTNAYSHTVIDANGSGGIHFKAQAPLKDSSSPFKGIVVYQDPDLCSGSDMTSSGNGLQIETQGVWYMPTSNVTLSGAISKNADVATQCMLMVVNTLTVNGGVTMSAAGCDAYGVSAPVITN